MRRAKARTLYPFVAAAAAVLALTACSPVDGGSTVLVGLRVAEDPVLGPCEGITLIVDERTMAGTGGGGYADPSAQCLETDGAMTAHAALDAGGVGITGTVDSGPAVVCRVYDSPNSNLAITKPERGIYFETCESTPPDYARWTVWHSPAGGPWSSTNQDITALQVAPGDSLALVFTYLGEPSTPWFAEPEPTER